MWRLFDRGRDNQLSLVEVVDDADYRRVVGVWLSGRVCGRYVSFYLPWRRWR